ncbi:hypothetical protein, partial [Pseudomonas aeruginosa]|uniref:hypothetical protein n=1 Tax=Pseudomonas aeruginosa TaxID=287 RepID=UPI001C733542
AQVGYSILSKFIDVTKTSEITMETGIAKYRKTKSTRFRLTITGDGKKYIASAKISEQIEYRSK